MKLAPVGIVVFFSQFVKAGAFSAFKGELPSYLLILLWAYCIALWILLCHFKMESNQMELLFTAVLAALVLLSASPMVPVGSPDGKIPTRTASGRLSIAPTPFAGDSRTPRELVAVKRARQGETDPLAGAQGANLAGPSVGSLANATENAEPGASGDDVTMMSWDQLLKAFKERGIKEGTHTTKEESATILRCVHVVSQLKMGELSLANVSELTAQITGKSNRTVLRVKSEFENDGTLYDGHFEHAGGRPSGSRDCPTMASVEMNAFIREHVRKANMPDGKKNGKGTNYRQLYKAACKNFGLKTSRSDPQHVTYDSFRYHCKSMGLRRCVGESKHTLKY